MDLKIIRDYKDNAVLRHSFNELAGLVFRIDFEKWYRYGFWNDRYICYSIVDGNKVVSNVSANMLDIVINGKRINSMQIGTVMTHPEYRKKGLAERLMNTVLEEYKGSCELIFLFGNMRVVDFYPKFGFIPVKETQFYANNSIEPVSSRIRKLDMSDMKDVEIMRQIIWERVTLSSSFGVERTEGILAWHCLNVFPENTYYLEEIDAVVIFKVKDDVLHLYDVACREKPDLKQITGMLMPQETREVILHFTPDSENLRIKKRAYISEDYIFFVKSKSVQLTGEFFYPYTAHA